MPSPLVAARSRVGPLNPLVPPSPGELADTVRGGNKEPYTPGDPDAIASWHIKIRAQFDTEGVLYLLDHGKTPSFGAWYRALLAAHARDSAHLSDAEAKALLYIDYVKNRRADSRRMFNLILAWPGVISRDTADLLKVGGKMDTERHGPALLAALLARAQFNAPAQQKAIVTELAELHILAYKTAR